MSFRRQYASDGGRIQIGDVQSRPSGMPKSPINNPVISEKYLQKKKSVLPSKEEVREILYPKDPVISLNSASPSKTGQSLTCQLDKKTLNVKLSANIGLEKWFHDDKKHASKFNCDPLSFIQQDLDRLSNEVDRGLIA